MLIRSCACGLFALLYFQVVNFSLFVCLFVFLTVFAVVTDHNLNKQLGLKLSHICE